MFDKRKFMAQVVLKGMSLGDLANALGIDRSTLYRKINAEGRFTRMEINNLITILDIKDPDSIFFA